jgi:hypothetical protein
MRKRFRNKHPLRDILWLSAIGVQPNKLVQGGIELLGATSPGNEEADS